jgi:hypothetical protein
MPELFESINNQAIHLVNNIRVNLFSTGTSATGKTSQSLRFELKQEGVKYKMQLFGRPFFMTVQTGRKPTPDKKPSREMISNLIPWMEARGMDSSKVWGVATRIQQRGTRLWFEGGREDIVDPAVDEFINGVSQDILKLESDNFVLKVKDGFNS